MKGNKVNMTINTMYLGNGVYVNTKKIAALKKIDSTKIQIFFDGHSLIHDCTNEEAAAWIFEDLKNRMGT